MRALYKKKLENNLGPDVSFGLRERWLNFNMEAIVWGNLDGRLRDSLGNNLTNGLMCYIEYNWPPSRSWPSSL
jgi:hypothetical protein